MEESPISRGEQNQSVNSFESKLSPELLDLVMKKVIDIRKEGTAFSTITPGNTSGFSLENQEKIFQSVLHYGLLSSRWAHAIYGFSHRTSQGNTSVNEAMDSKVGLQKFRRTEGDYIDDKIFFNVVGHGVELTFGEGRDDGLIGRLTDIPVDKFYEETHYVTKGISKDNELLPDITAYNLSVIFDLDNYKSEREMYLKNMKSVPAERQGYQGKPNRVRSYTYNDPTSMMEKIIKKDLPLSSDGLPKTDVGYGFSILNRVPPKFFKGLIFNSMSDLANPEEVLCKIEDILLKEYNNNPELLIPIYNIQGDMLWPRKIPHEDILNV